MEDAVYLGLGSNLGEPELNLAAAREALRGRGFRITAASRVYETEPQGVADQPWFRNQVVRVSPPPGADPVRTLGILQGIEAELGRVRSPGLRYGPRVIDVDILLWGGLVMHDARLELPHPRLKERAFVLVPLTELAPDLVLPSGERAADVLAALLHTKEGSKIFQ